MRQAYQVRTKAHLRLACVSLFLAMPDDRKKCSGTSCPILALHNRQQQQQQQQQPGGRVSSSQLTAAAASWSVELDGALGECECIWRDVPFIIGGVVIGRPPADEVPVPVADSFLLAAPAPYELPFLLLMAASSADDGVRQS